MPTKYKAIRPFGWWGQAPFSLTRTRSPQSRFRIGILVIFVLRGFRIRPTGLQDRLEGPSHNRQIHPAALGDETSISLPNAARPAPAGEVKHGPKCSPVYLMTSILKSLCNMPLWITPRRRHTLPREEATHATPKDKLVVYVLPTAMLLEGLGTRPAPWGRRPCRPALTMKLASFINSSRPAGLCSNFVTAAPPAGTTRMPEPTPP